MKLLYITLDKNQHNVSIMSCSWLRNAEASEDSSPHMQTISASANLQSLRDRTCFHFLKKAKRGCADREEGAESTVYTCTWWDVTVGREILSDSSEDKRVWQKSREKRVWSNCDSTKTPNLIGKQAKTGTLPQEIHSLIICQVALCRDGGNRVT